MVIESSEIEVLTNTRVTVVSFLSFSREWNNICITDSIGITSLVNWTLSYIFYIDDALNLLDNDIIVKFYSEGYFSLQHTDGHSAYNRHLSCSERSKWENY